jgi:hypothetical protein
MKYFNLKMAFIIRWYFWHKFRIIFYNDNMKIKIK